MTYFLTFFKGGHSVHEIKSMGFKFASDVTMMPFISEIRLPALSLTSLSLVY